MTFNSTHLPGKQVHSFHGFKPAEIASATMGRPLIPDQSSSF